jgi:hypothetical protein
MTGIDVPKEYKQKREFQVTHTTVVTGKLSNEYFGQDSSVELPGEIFTIETEDVPFTSIA